MKFFLDENLSMVSLEPLRLIFRNRHTFEHAGSLDLLGVDDVDLFPRVQDAGVNAIITKDGRQLVNPAERRGLYDAGLTFIQINTGKANGRTGIGLELAAITAGLPYIEDNWPQEPWIFRLRGLQSKFSERVSSSRPLWHDSWDA